MGFEGDPPDFDPEIEGFNMRSNILRPGRNLLTNPLSEYELNTIRLDHPEWRLPSTETMLNAQEELLRRRPDIDFTIKPTVPDYTLPDLPKYEPSSQLPSSSRFEKYSWETMDDWLERIKRETKRPTPIYEFKPSLPEPDDKEEAPKGDLETLGDAAGEFTDALGLIFNPFNWFK